MNENHSTKNLKNYRRKIDNLRLYLKIIDKEIRQYQFKILLIKGLAYSYLISEKYLRPTSDIDLWCSKEDFGRICCLFYRLGFENIEGGTPGVGQRAVHLYNGQISFDLHQYLGLENSLTLDFDKVYEDAFSIGNLGYIKCPRLEEQILILSHIYAYESIEQNLKIEKDLELLANTKLDLIRLIELAKFYRIEKKLANLLKKSSLKDSISKKLKRSEPGMILFDQLANSGSPLLLNLISEIMFSPNPFFGLRVIYSSYKNRVFKKYGLSSEIEKPT